MILRAERDVREITNSQTTLYDHIRNIVGRFRFLRGYNQILPIVLWHAADCSDTRALLDRSGEVVVGDACRGKSRRVGNDLYLSYITSLHINSANTGNARDQRLDL